MTIKKINMPENVSLILKMLNNNGCSAYIVGGCVRDSIMKREPHDWDICTSAKPCDIIETFKDYKTIPTGIEHGTVTIVIDDERYEVTTYRVDGEYSDNRRPDNVEFTDDIAKDLSRRDFTMNAIAYNKDGFVDPFNGIKDIKKKIIRCVGNPEDRFNEDGLRILRAVRFAAQLDFFPEEKTYSAIMNCVDLLDNISKERIQSELCKILECKYCGEYMLDIFDKVVFKIIPEAEEMFEFGLNNRRYHRDLWKHILDCMNYFVCPMGEESHDDIILRLSVLLHDIGKPRCHTINDSIDVSVVSAKIAYRILKELKFSNEIVGRVTQLISYSYVELNEDKPSIKHLLNSIGEEQLRRLIILNKSDLITGQGLLKKEKHLVSDITSAERVLNKIVANNECYNLKMLAVNGDDLIERGVPEGKAVGDILNILLDNVIEENIPNERNTLLQAADEIARIYNN